MSDWPGFSFDPGARNRVPDDQILPILDIRILDGSGVEHRYDPNRVLIAAMGGEVRHMPPDPSKSSVISGEAGCLTYRSVDLSIDLTPAEMDRFIRHALRPDEYKALGDKYGLAFEWHEDFYHPQSGRAEQPLRAPWDE
ncbi:hypothetical protein [Azospirillum brasilense]|uniref:hypothetical protein n=1 Tax=Azospirillum brasilense TaxID=192 RepID=UPI000E67F81C|nr:hypothetical protein [Azospirillum brasilense]NUB23326.1 hypothetical protein [Azospirillum brasilense]NUB30948.1 hypothetical protein [Azospirillum brasilense]RIW05669.1 hypothetical protein D2T81_07435 [Azospirillum brasilense]